MDKNVSRVKDISKGELEGVILKLETKHFKSHGTIKTRLIY